MSNIEIIELKKYAAYEGKVFKIVDSETPSYHTVMAGVNLLDYDAYEQVPIQEMLDYKQSLLDEQSQEP